MPPAAVINWLVSPGTTFYRTQRYLQAYPPHDPFDLTDVAIDARIVGPDGEVLFDLSDYVTIPTPATDGYILWNLPPAQTVLIVAGTTYSVTLEWPDGRGTPFCKGEFVIDALPGW